MDRITEMNRGFLYIESKVKKLEKEVIAKSKVNITRRELTYVVIVNDNQGKTLSEILETSGVTKATLSNQIKVLVNKGMVKTETDLKDSRKKRLTLTDKGMKAYGVHAQIRQLILAEYRDILTEAEINTIIKIGKKIIKRIKEVK